MGNLSWRIGDIAITRVLETETALPPEGLLPEANEASLARHRSWLEPHFLDAEGRPQAIEYRTLTRSLIEGLGARALGAIEAATARLASDL